MRRTLLPERDVRGYTPTAAERALSLSMQRYWGSFAATGAPTATGSATWTEFDPVRDSHLVLDAGETRMAEGVNKARCDFWALIGL